MFESGFFSDVFQRLQKTIFKCAAGKKKEGIKNKRNLFIK